VADLVASLAAASEPPPAQSVLAHIQALVRTAFLAARSYSKRLRQGPGAEAAAAASADGDAAGEGCSTEAHAQPAAQDPLSLQGLRALLLQLVPAAVADLRRQHSRSEEPWQRSQLAQRLLVELLLRFCICAWGERGAAAQGPVGRGTNCLLRSNAWLPFGEQCVPLFAHRLLPQCPPPTVCRPIPPLPPCVVPLPAGARTGGDLPPSQYPEIEVLMQVRPATAAGQRKCACAAVHAVHAATAAAWASAWVGHPGRRHPTPGGPWRPLPAQCLVATLQPIPHAGHDFFTATVAKAFGEGAAGAAHRLCRRPLSLPGVHTAASQPNSCR
jgi:hypothetical protein